MKKFARITGVIIIVLGALFLIFTDRVDNAPYLTSDYFKAACKQIDSLKKDLIIEKDSLKAGFAKVSITPGLNYPEENYAEGKFTQVSLAGYGARKGKPATGIHDSLFVKSVALKTGTNLIVFITADLLIMPPNIIDAVTERLSQAGYIRDQLFFSATHSHSSIGGWGPGFLARQFAGKENQNIEKWLVQQIALAVMQAAADLQPASMGTGSFDAGSFTRNRLIGESGTKNDDFDFLIIDQIGEKKAVIGCFSSHSTTLGDENMEFSADYPGYWARKMEKGSTDFALFFAGSMGSQSPVGKGDGFEKARYIGEALADSLIREMHGVIMDDIPVMSSLTLKIPLPVYNMRITPKISLSTFLSKKLMPFPENAYLQVARLGDLIWITTPSDFSGEYAVQIKNALAAKGFNSMVTSFNGSYVGYIIPGRYFFLDEYESKVMGWFGPNMGEYTMDLIRQLSDGVIKK